MTNKKGIIVIGLILVATIIITIIYHPKSPGSKEAGTSAIEQTHTASLNVYEVDGGWAYEVLIDHKKLIIQEQIPGLPNDKKFVSKTDAKKCGDLVIKKMQAKQMPSISIAELDSLNIRY